MQLIGKVALITGGTKGIGKGIALELAKAGCAIAINYNKDDKAAEITIAEIKDLGFYAYSLKKDVSLYTEASELIKDTIKQFGKIDILVNNCGISHIGLLMDTTEQDWDNIINVNLKSIYNCTHNILPHMIERKKGNIINISSIWGEVGASCEVIYSATKGGINAFTKALAKEVAASGVRVNAIAPGVINTSMNSWLNEDEQAALLAEIPIGYFGKPEDIGKLCAFLASDDSSYITGQIIKADGGFI